MAQSCCNPFSIPGHSWASRKKNLRPVTEWMHEKAPQISESSRSRIRDYCRKKLSKSPSVAQILEEDSSSSEAYKPGFLGSEPTPETDVYVDNSEAIASLNLCLADIRR